MAVTFYIAGYLSSFAEGNSSIVMNESPSTVGEALTALWTRHVGLRDRIVTESGEIRPHVNIFVGSRSVKRESGLQTTVEEGDEISILAAVSGG
jgi:molybdopterin synthase sulfur carrier subunit